MRRRAIALLLAGFAGAGLAGCGGTGHAVVTRDVSARPVVVPITVHRSRSAVVVFVRLAVDGHPYDFVVDTGAVRTVIDAQVAKKLGLRGDGSPRQFWTLGCPVSAQPVAVPALRLGDASFSGTTVFTRRLRLPRAPSRFRVAGVLGSDFLSRFGAVTVDLTHRRLILGASISPGPRDDVVGIRLVRAVGGAWITTRVGLDHRHAGFIVDTGAAFSMIDSTAAARLRLRAVGPRTRITGAVCTTAATLVAVHDWRFADLDLPHGFIVRAKRALPDRLLRKGVVGIVGMATLARFGTLTIDYPHARMILGDKAGGGAQ
jgi:predicted aspartyl protease